MDCIHSQMLVDCDQVSPLWQLCVCWNYYKTGVNSFMPAKVLIPQFYDMKDNNIHKISTLRTTHYMLGLSKSSQIKLFSPE